MNIQILMRSLLICSGLMTALTLLYLAVSHLLKKRQSALWRYAAWWVLGLGFLFPVKPQIGSGLIAVGPVVAEYETQGIAVQMHSPASRVSALLLAVWAVGFAVTAVRMLRRQIRFSRSIRRLRRPADAAAQTVLELTCIEMEMPCTVRAYSVPVIPSPMLSGLRHPAILLPEREYTAQELRLICKHELTHLDHGDLWCKLLWLGAQAVHWFNPLMPVLMRRMEQDCELACDEAVMRGETDESAAVYCNSILETALQHCRGGQAPILATNFSGSREMLRDRMAAILARTERRRFWLIPAGISLLTLLTGSVFALWQHSYQVRRQAETIAYTEPMPITVTTMPAGTSIAVQEAAESSAVMTETVPQMLHPTMTTAYIGEDGMVYAVTGYSTAQERESRVTVTVMPQYP